MSRLIVVSNRLPVSVSRRKGGFVYTESVGGVATGISSLEEEGERLWFGWPGITSDKLTQREREEINEELVKRNCRGVFLSSRNIRDFYSGFSNKTIWPLFHYFSEFAVFEEEYWQSYMAVNQLFCDEVMKEARDNDIIWVHDYQLMLLPSMIREKVGRSRIGFFLHIPFPSFELVRNLPWRTEILDGLLGADLIGFHEYDYVRHFLSSVYRICGHEHHLSSLSVGNRRIRVDAFPMGINFEKYATSMEDPDVQRESERLSDIDIKVILSVDRLDYTKGVLNRLDAYDWFLMKYPEYRGKVLLAVVAVPSRTSVKSYAFLREEVEKTVSRINGAYGTLGWSPVSYMYRSMSFEELSAMYHLADVALITPLRDGMNLVAKEYVATQSQKDEQGILILSEMAGAACELSEAIVINPHDRAGVVEAIKDALEMPQEERRRRNASMQSRLSRYTVGRWARDFISSLKEVKREQGKLSTREFSRDIQEATAREFAVADRKLILLDYDGTLVSFVKSPGQARPDEELLGLLERLASHPENDVVVISGRDKDTLSDWFGRLPLNLVAEHGAFYRIKEKGWSAAVQFDDVWKKIIRPILELSVDRTPGSFIEEKCSALVWHFRGSDPDLAKLRTQELKDALVMMVTNLDIGVFEGDKIVEVKPVSINKGEAVKFWLNREEWGFVFCAGDDYTDEDMFLVLPEHAISCKIGAGSSNARFMAESPCELRHFLSQLVGTVKGKR